jgi:hypothetical protein
MKKYFIFILFLGVMLSGVAVNANATVCDQAGGCISVPEPATMLLLGFGIIGLAGLRRFKK